MIWLLLIPHQRAASYIEYGNESEMFDDFGGRNEGESRADFLVRVLHDLHSYRIMESIEDVKAQLYISRKHHTHQWISVIAICEGILEDEENKFLSKRVNDDLIEVAHAFKVKFGHELTPNHDFFKG